MRRLSTTRNMCEDDSLLPDVAMARLKSDPGPSGVKKRGTQGSSSRSASVPSGSGSDGHDTESGFRVLPPQEDDNESVDNRSRHVDGESFTVRGVLVGLVVGTVICFSNMYFGLQTGWVSIMSMPASLLGFGIFSTLLRGGHVKLPFSPWVAPSSCPFCSPFLPKTNIPGSVENVLVQSVAGGMAIMPLGCGFVGVVPAMDRLLRTDEGGPFVMGPGQSVVWALGLCYFGVVFAVPLRR